MVILSTFSGGFFLCKFLSLVLKRLCPLSRGSLIVVNRSKQPHRYFYAMENTNFFCQSCSMPLESTDVVGTEKDGSPSKDYCKYCYQDGHFTDPNTTLEQMKTIVKTEMEKRFIPAAVIKKAVDILPELKRWKQSK
jgi:methionyl-tRNA synthetase